MKRKLASVQRVLDITPIEGADAIERVQINGWQCVVKKGAFAVGDRGVFFEIDAIPPDLGVYRFLWTPRGSEPAAGQRPESFRVRTMRLRGCLSQGLFLSLSEVGLDPSIDDGTDVTERLGVRKYEPPMPSGMGDLRAPFPSVVPKTDEERVQSAPGVLDELRGHPYVATLKCDGTSATYLIHPDDGSFHACGRNWSIAEGANLYWSVAKDLDIEAKLRAVGGRYALQGELCGPGVQGNKLGLPRPTLRVFNVVDLVEHRSLSHDAAREVIAAMGLSAVPVVEEGESFQHDLESILALAEGRYPGTKNEREGVVVRARHEMQSATLGGRLSFKAISNRYLLREA